VSIGSHRLPLLLHCSPDCYKVQYRRFGGKFGVCRAEACDDRLAGSYPLSRLSDSRMCHGRWAHALREYPALPPRTFSRCLLTHDRMTELTIRILPNDLRTVFVFVLLQCRIPLWFLPSYEQRTLSFSSHDDYIQTFSKTTLVLISYTYGHKYSTGQNLQSYLGDMHASDASLQRLNIRYGTNRHDPCGVDLIAPRQLAIRFLSNTTHRNMRPIIVSFDVVEICVGLELFLVPVKFPRISK
jgi:hypothetical protein